MKTPVGAKNCARRPLQQLPANSLRDAVPSITSNENNLSGFGTKDTKNTNNMKGQLEKRDLLLESIEKQIHNMKINDTKKVVDENPEPKTEYNIQALSERVKNVSLEVSLTDAKSDLKSKLVSNVCDDEGEQNSGTKTKEEEKEPDSDKDKGPQPSDTTNEKKADDDDDSEKSCEIKTDLCSRGPIGRDHNLLRPAPYMNKNVICSQSHHSGGAVSEAPRQSQEMLNHMTGSVYSANIPVEEELQFPEYLLNDPKMLNMVNIVLQNNTYPQPLPSVNVTTAHTATYDGMYSNEKAHSPVPNTGEGYPESPDSSFTMGCVSPLGGVDFEPLGNLEERLTAEADSTAGLIWVNQGPRSVDSGRGSLSPPLSLGAPSPQPGLVQNTFSPFPQEPMSNRNDVLGYFPKNDSLSQPVNQYPVSVHQQIQSTTLSTVPPTTKPLPPLLPHPPKKTPAQKKFYEKLDPNRKNSSWAKVNSVSVDDLISSDGDGDTQLMIILSNQCENFLEVVYFLVERLRKIPGALAKKNKKGYSALYIASVHLPNEPLVAAYIAEALMKEGINVAELEYNGLPLIECVEKRGKTHKKVLDELCSVKNKNGQYIFAPQNNCSVNVRV